MQAKPFLKWHGLFVMSVLMSTILLFNSSGKSDAPMQKVGDYTIVLKVSPDPPRRWLEYLQSQTRECVRRTSERCNAAHSLFHASHGWDACHGGRG